jgi:hypothetical protein
MEGAAVHVDGDPGVLRPSPRRPIRALMASGRSHRDEMPVLHQLPESEVESPAPPTMIPKLLSVLRDKSFMMKYFSP